MSQARGYGSRMKSQPCRNEAEYALRRRAKAAVVSWVEHANSVVLRDGAVPMPAVRFDLQGRTAGMAVYGPRHTRETPALLRVNADLLWRYPDEMIDETIPHEVAHVVTRWAWGGRVAPHGREWKSIMRAFGKEPTRCHTMETTSARRTPRYPYRCACEKTVYLGQVRHRRALKQPRRYICPRCRNTLIYTGGEAVVESA